MSEENDTGKHEFNFFLDKQIQQKLLEADEVIAAQEAALYKNQLAASKVQIAPSSSNGVLNSNASSNLVNLKANQSKPLKDSLRANISGWCSGSGVVYRKTETDTPPRARGQQSLRDALSRDSKFRPHTHNPQDFVFRHYADPRKYIEQYRKEHSCYDTTTTSATRSEFLETRRFYAYNQYSPLAVPTQSNAPPFSNNPLPSSHQDVSSTSEQALYSQKKQQQPQQAPTLQYTNRREQTKQTISASLRPSNLYKLSKSNTTNMEKAKTPEQLQESNSEGQIKRAGSARGSASPGVNGVALQRNATTSDIERLSARGQKNSAIGVPSDSTSSNQFLGRKLGQVTSAQTRTLDALAACHAPIGGKQEDEVPDTAETLEDSFTLWPDRPQEFPTSARSIRHHAEAEVLAKSPGLHRGHGGANEKHRAGHMTASSRSYLAPPTMPLDTSGSCSGVNGLTSREKARRKSGHRNLEDAGGAKLENGRGSALSDTDSAVSASGQSAVSIDQLSTTCLGAEVTVKPLPKLEASRTYHVFPTETLVKEAALPGAPPLRLWSPGKSSAVIHGKLGMEGGAANKPLLGGDGRDGGVGGTSQLFDPGLGSPFRTSPRLTRPRTQESRTRSTVEFITKEFMGGARHTVNLCPDWHRGPLVVGGGGSISSSGGGASAGLKANTIQPDLPPTFQLKGISTQPHLAAGGGAGAVTRRKRGLSKTAVGRGKRDSRAGLQLESTDRNSWSASTTDTTTSSGKGNVQSTHARKKIQVGLDIAAAGSSSSRQQGGATPPSLGPVPYFKFWNSSIPPKSRESRRNGGKRERGLRVGVGLDGGELNLAQLAQLVLADDAGRQDRGLADAAQKVLEEQQRLEQLQTTQRESPHRAGQGSIATGISGDPQAAGSPAITWPCPEGRMEQLKRVRRRHLAQPAPPAPQLTFIKEGDETAGQQQRQQQQLRGRSSWPGTGENSKDDAVHAGIEVVGAATVLGEGSGSCGDGSSLLASGGTSVRTSISSFNSGSNSSGSKKHWKTSKSKAEDTTVNVKQQNLDQPLPESVPVSNPPALSSSSLPSTSVATHMLADPFSTLSWRERVQQQQQQQKAMTSSGDAGVNPLYAGGGRWAVARRQEELSSIAHAQRIKHLIEQSRQRGAAGLSLARSLSEEDERGGRGRRESGDEGQKPLRVEGQQQQHHHHHQQQKKIFHVPLTATTPGWDYKGTAAATTERSGPKGGVLPSSHLVLPPVAVRKTKGEADGRSSEGLPKPHASANPVLGDLLDAQSFFSHCIPLSSTDAAGKQQPQHYSSHHPHSQRFTPPEKSYPAALTKSGGNTSSLLGGDGSVPGPAASRITIATAAVIGNPPQPRLKYCSSVQHKLTGGCLP